MILLSTDIDWTDVPHMPFSKFKQEYGEHNWAPYAKVKNAQSAERWRTQFLSNYDNGVLIQGRDIRNKTMFFNYSPYVLKALQHDDTKVSRTEVEARGLPRPLAKKLFKQVTDAIAIYRSAK